MSFEIWESLAIRSQNVVELSKNPSTFNELGKRIYDLSVDFQGFIDELLPDNEIKYTIKTQLRNAEMKLPIGHLSSARIPFIAETLQRVISDSLNQAKKKKLSFIKPMGFQQNIHANTIGQVAHTINNNISVADILSHTKTLILNDSSLTQDQKTKAVKGMETLLRESWDVMKGITIGAILKMSGLN